MRPLPRFNVVPVLSGFLTIILAFSASAVSVICAPQAAHADYTVKREYQQDGSMDVPDGITSVDYELYGPRGGDSVSLGTSLTPGGPGAKVTGTLAVKSHEVLAFQLGQPGEKANYSRLGAPGGTGYKQGGKGADAGPRPFYSGGGGGGGGASAIFKQGQPWVVAGGGGGAGGGSNMVQHQPLPGPGGAAGHKGGDSTGCANPKANQGGGTAGANADAEGQSSTPATWDGAGGAGGGGGGDGHVATTPGERICVRDPARDDWPGPGGGGGGGASKGGRIGISDEYGAGRVVFSYTVKGTVGTSIVGWIDPFHPSDIRVEVRAASGDDAPLGTVRVSWPGGSAEKELEKTRDGVASVMIPITDPSLSRTYFLGYEPADPGHFQPSETVVTG